INTKALRLFIDIQLTHSHFQQQQPQDLPSPISVIINMFSRNVTFFVFFVMMITLMAAFVNAACDPEYCCGCSGGRCMLCADVIETTHGEITVKHLATLIQNINRK
ncbi:hypothetical protein BGZ76_004996, partial [Entomortierella beljakovae]